jgi:hypothetical protein
MGLSDGSLRLPFQLLQLLAELLKADGGAHGRSMAEVDCRQLTNLPQGLFSPGIPDDSAIRVYPTSHSDQQ